MVMDKVFIDTNIMIDVLLGRKKFLAQSSNLLDNTLAPIVWMNPSMPDTIYRFFPGFHLALLSGTTGNIDKVL